jgi:hypothetical protein
MSLDRLVQIASKEASMAEPGVNPDLLQKTLDYLYSKQSLEDLTIDPYWPKWNGPWWHMMLLHEMGMTKAIPTGLVQKLIEQFNSYFLDFFPFHESEVPAGRDPLNHVACHCQLGSVYQLLSAYGVDVDVAVPWISPWFIKYQMVDGGLNCDEAAYTREAPKSSVVSTLPPLEAVLFYAKDGRHSEAQIIYLDRGAEYLIKRKLFRGSTNGAVIDGEWLKVCFPRFYHYDILRGLNFLTEWAIRLNRQLPIDAILETVEILDAAFPDGEIKVQRAAWDGAKSRWYDVSTGTWSRGPAASHPLLEAVGSVGVSSPYLTRNWVQTKQNLLKLKSSNQLENVRASSAI